MLAKTLTVDVRKSHPRPIQAFGEVAPVAIALAEGVRKESVKSLNQLLADTLSLRDLYKKHHWQASGSTFYLLHLLFDKHAGEQTELADAIAERVQTLGGVAVASAHDVAETTLLPRPPRDREAPRDQIARLLHAHEIVLEESRTMARSSTSAGDDGTSDLIVSHVIRANESQGWLVGEHVRPDAEPGS